MLLTPFPEAIPVLTDLMFILEKRFDNFLLVLAQSNNIIEHLVHFAT